MCSWELECWFTDVEQIGILIWIHLSSSWTQMPTHFSWRTVGTVWLSSAYHYPFPHPHIWVLGGLVSSLELLPHLLTLTSSSCQFQAGTTILWTPLNPWMMLFWRTVNCIGVNSKYGGSVFPLFCFVFFFSKITSIIVCPCAEYYKSYPCVATRL